MTQIREVAARFMAYAKTSETPVFLVGHVTKDGAIAGPRVLEHMVDTVLYFEGGGAHPYRVLRAHKNRFGSASEIGVFEMKAGGLAEVTNPSALFLAERPEDAPGSAVTAVLNGTRTVLVEIQALVAPTGFGTPRRTALGIDSNRVALLAVLEKKVGMEILGCDLFVNVAGGLSVDDPAADLAAVAALASSFRDQAPRRARSCSARSGSRERCARSRSRRSGSRRRPRVRARDHPRRERGRMTPTCPPASRWSARRWRRADRPG